MVNVEGKNVPVFGQYAIDQLAIVSLPILKRLIGFLPTASLREIKASFIESINDSSNIEEYVDTIKEELEFQLSVNQITEYTATENIVGVVHRETAIMG